MYQPVPQPVGPRAPAARVLLAIDVPSGLGSSAADVARMVDEFAVTLARFVPGVRAHDAVVSTPATKWDQPGLTLDVARRQVRVDGRLVRLAYREFELFAYLAAAPHRTISRAALLRTVWCDRHPGHDEISDRTVDSHVRRLRAKLGDYAHVITTVRGHGYRFDPSADIEIPTALSRTL